MNTATFDIKRFKVSKIRFIQTAPSKDCHTPGYYELTNGDGRKFTTWNEAYNAAHN